MATPVRKYCRCTPCPQKSKPKFFLQTTTLQIVHKFPSKLPGTIAAAVNGKQCVCVCVCVIRLWLCVNTNCEMFTLSSTVLQAAGSRPSAYVYSAYVDDRRAPDVSQLFVDSRPVLRVFAWMPRHRPATCSWHCLFWHRERDFPLERPVIAWTDLNYFDTNYTYATFCQRWKNPRFFKQKIGFYVYFRFLGGFSLQKAGRKITTCDKYAQWKVKTSPVSKY